MRANIQQRMFGGALLNGSTNSLQLLSGEMQGGNTQSLQVTETSDIFRADFHTCDDPNALCGE